MPCPAPAAPATPLSLEDALLVRLHDEHIETGLMNWDDLRRDYYPKTTKSSLVLQYLRATGRGVERPGGL